MPLRKPRKPRGIGSTTPQPRGRKPGFAPQYDPEQTAQYKSQALRYAKATELASAGPDFVEWNGGILSGDDVDGLRDKGNNFFAPSDRLLFRYASPRAPLDYWTVTYGGGGLTAIASFADAVTTTGTDACTVPVVTWNWESPKFQWAAAGIKLCPGDPAPPDGASSYTLPSNFPGSYKPVPPGQTRVVTIRSTLVRTDDSLAMPPGGDGVPRHTVNNPFVVTITRTLTDADAFTNIYDSGSSSGGTVTVVYGSVKVYLNGSTINFNSFTGFDFTTQISGGADYFKSVYVTTVLITGDGPLLAPPAGTPPPFDLPDFLPETPNPFPPPDIKATAGGTFTSNTFTLTAAIATQITLDYTTVAGLGAPTGAIAIQLYDDTNTLLDALTVTPTEGSAGQLQATFNLEAGLAYYLKIVIPATCYCDAATVTIGGAGFECDCPDFTKTQGTLLNSRYNSEQVARDWSESAAGCDPDTGCKHVVGTQIFLGIPVEVPTDYPY